MYWFLCCMLSDEAQCVILNRIDVHLACCSLMPDIVDGDVVKNKQSQSEVRYDGETKFDIVRISDALYSICRHSVRSLDKRR